MERLRYRSFSMGRGRKGADEDSLIIANIQAVAIIGLFVTLGSVASVAMPPQEVAAEVKACKAISDDKERLRCFDGLFGATPKPEKSEEGKQAKLVYRGDQVTN